MVIGHERPAVGILDPVELEAALASMGLHSTPVSVAQFFTTQLEELVAEVGGGKAPGTSHREGSAQAVVSTAPTSPPPSPPDGTEAGTWPTGRRLLP